MGDQGGAPGLLGLILRPEHLALGPQGRVLIQGGVKVPGVLDDDDDDQSGMLTD